MQALDAVEQVKRFKQFVEDHYYSEVLDHLRTGKNYVVFSFPQLSKFDPDMANELLDNPEEVIKAAELAISQFGEQTSSFKVRFSDLPPSQLSLIRDIRSLHLGKFITIDGIVRQKSDVRPQVTAAKFECPNCGNVINVLQLDGNFKEPSKCGCGRKGKFSLLSKELVDAQGIVVEESPERLEGGQQPKRINVFLKDDLVSPLSEKKSNPGSKVTINGVVKEVPILLRTGAKSTRYDLLMEANYLEASQETFYEVEISDEEEQAIKDLAEDPQGYQKILNSMAPSIYGYDRIKESLLLQLVGGVRKVRQDKVVSRGDMHVLLVGDPGCIAGNSQVSLPYQGMKPIQSFGKTHLEPIKAVVTKIKKNSKEKDYDFATVFHKYEKQPVLRITTETGKEIVCTYNQPLLAQEGWVRADELIWGEGIRVAHQLPNANKKYVRTEFKEIKSKRVKRIPQVFTPELAGLCGYILGNGYVHQDKYAVSCVINNEEIDLFPTVNAMWKSTFDVIPSLYVKNTTAKTIDVGSGVLKQSLAQPLHCLEVNSRQVAQNLSFLGIKQVPQQIFQSPKKVVASFISWLFEAECAFVSGKGRTAIQFKSVTKKILQDVQLLLLYFGIQSRIVVDALCIKRSEDIKLYAKHIGFQSIKKKERLGKILAEIKKGKQTKERLQRYEKIADISPAGVIDVYDFEVPVSHSFIANGIVCHNSGKSQMLKRMSVIAPKARYVSGKGVSGAGITASVVRDEFLKGWALEAGALVLANEGIVMVDEMDKMNPEDTAAMHEALEQQSVSISKANIQATLVCRTTVLAAANPKFGRFDPFGIVGDQIDMPPTLINRFDLIFPIKDLPDDVRDDKLATHILGLHQAPDDQPQELTTDFLKKYIAYAKQYVHPHLSNDALEEIKGFYLKMRMSGSNEGGVRTVPISARQLEALVRMAEAAAKVRLSNKVTRKDAKKAVELLEYCLMQVGLDKDTGKIDIDRIATGVGASQRSHIIQVKEIISDLESKGEKTMAMEDIINEAQSRGIEADKVDEAIEKLKRTGDIFEPRRGFISKL